MKLADLANKFLLCERSRYLVFQVKQKAAEQVANLYFKIRSLLNGMFTSLIVARKRIIFY